MDKLTDDYAATMREADPEVRQAAIDALEDASMAWRVEYEALTAEAGAYGQKKMRAGLLLASRLASLRAGNIRALE